MTPPEKVLVALDRDEAEAALYRNEPFGDDHGINCGIPEAHEDQDRHVGCTCGAQEQQEYLRDQAEKKLAAALDRDPDELVEQVAKAIVVENRADSNGASVAEIFREPTSTFPYLRARYLALAEAALSAVGGEQE